MKDYNAGGGLTVEARDVLYLRKSPVQLHTCNDRYNLEDEVFSITRFIFGQGNKRCEINLCRIALIL